MVILISKNCIQIKGGKDHLLFRDNLSYNPGLFNIQGFMDNCTWQVRFKLPNRERPL